MTNPFGLVFKDEEEENPFGLKFGSKPEPGKLDRLDGWVQDKVDNTRRRLMGIDRLVFAATGSDDPQAVATREALRVGYANANEGNKIAANDITHMFDKTNLVDKAKGAGSSVRKFFSPEGNIEITGENTGEAFKTILNLPIDMAHSMAKSTFHSLSGVRIGEGGEIIPLSPVEYSKDAKELIGNAVAAVTAPAISKAIAAGATARQAGMLGASRLSVPAAFEIETAGTNALAKVASHTSKLGLVGRTVLDDTVGAAVSGMAQGAVANANEENTLESMFMGLAFAPLGTAVGYFRGLGMIKDGKISATEQLSTSAREVLLARQFKSLKRVADAEHAAEGLFQADTFSEALAIQGLKENPKGVVHLLNTDLDKLDGYEVLRHKESAIAFEAGTLTRAQKNEFIATGNAPTKVVSSKKNVVTGSTEAERRTLVGYNGYEYILEGRKEGKATITNPVTQKTKNVPISELRQTSLVSSVVDTKATYDNAFKAYEIELEKTNDYEKAFTNFLNNNKITELPQNFEIEFNKRLHTKLVDMLEPEDRVSLMRTQSRLEQGALNKVLSHNEKISRLAYELDSNQYYVVNNQGRFQIRSQENSAHIYTATTIDEAREFVAQSGQAAGRALDTGAPTPTAAIPIEGRPLPAYSQEQLRALGMTGDSRSIAVFDAANSVMTSMPHHLDALDVIHKVNTGGIFSTVREAHGKASRQIREIINSNDVRFLNKAMDKLKTDRRIHITNYIEAKNIQELAAPGGIGGEHTMTKSNVAFATWMADEGIDPHQVLVYRRSMQGLERWFDNSAAEKANFQIELRRQEGYPDGMSMEEIAMFNENIRNSFRTDVRKSPEYTEQLGIIEEIAAGNPKFREAADAFNGMHEKFGVNKQYEAAGIVRYSDAVRDKENFGLSRAEYAQKHNMDVEELTAALIYENQNKKFAKEFNIPEHRQINGYVAHYRQYGDLLNLEGINKYVEGMEAVGTRDFVSEMLRTGELASYQSDPMQAMQSYIRSYVKSKELYPKLDQALKDIKVAQSKILDSKAKEQLGRVWSDIDAVLSGRETIEGGAAVAAYREHYKGFGYTQEQITKLASSSNSLDTFLSTTNASLMGGRLSMAMRDTNDALMKKFIFHGTKRTYDMLTQDVLSENSLKYLKEHGVITEADYASMYNPAMLGDSPGGKIASGSRKLAEWGYVASGQGWVNQRVQAAAYLESRKYSIPIWNDMVNGKITKEVGYEKLGLWQHDEHVKKSFDAALASGQGEGAIKILAMAEKDKMGGQFGLGVAPTGSGTLFGKLFNQMGTWSIQNRSVLMKMATKGTVKDRAGFYVRYAIAQGALYGTGRVLGINLSSWVLTPASLVFLGGPLRDTGAGAVSMARASLGGTEMQQEYSQRQFSRNLLMTVPFGYALRDMTNAYELANDGHGYGFVRPLLQAVGVGAIKDEGYRSGWDMINGNYPFMRDEEHFYETKKEQ